ncbi:hypothetical protein FGO68_gene13529 [Halteria grandinella]|uniref:Uncharacterized protein n=1 Tax=Halteria grandinella TaxID=5974 RepID=A0A8J8P1Z4_HALGN|nr:hypothetical protein FGO68_gene13529 [Halteria grandinella]
MGGGPGGQGGLILPPMVNASKYQSYQDSANKQPIEKHHLPPAGSDPNGDRRFNQNGLPATGAPSVLSGHRPSQPTIQQPNSQSSYFPTAQSVGAGGLPSASSAASISQQLKSNPVTATHLSDRKQSFDTVQNQTSQKNIKNAGPGGSGGYSALMI